MAGKADRTYKAIPWQGHRGRYVVVDIESGEVLDDAQGYGYRSPQKAYAGYGWKNRSNEAKEKERRIKAWMREHRKFVRKLDDAAFIAWEDSCGHESLRAKDVRELMRAEGIDEKGLGFTAGDLLRQFMR